MSYMVDFSYYYQLIFFLLIAVIFVTISYNLYKNIVIINIKKQVIIGYFLLLKL